MVHVNNYSKPMEFLEVAYRDLDFQEGSGFFRLPLTNITPDLAQAGWIEQAIRLRADSIFFVNGYPTVLFFNLDISPSSDNSSIEDNIRNLHLRVWNTCLVPLFFVALPGELRVYSAYQTPARNLTAWGDSSRYLNRIQTITKILELREFSRPEIETGNLFGKRPSEFDRRQRVDQWLLKNLRLLREKLGGEDETKREYIHALIGRSIFIRYLEDREILVNGYYSDDEISQNNKYRQYTDVLQSKDDTYNLFQKLRNDFNGDMFPLDSKEIETITQSDLNLLRDFLLGRSVGDQPDLLFWAYKFDIIPIELISGIYEEFYHEFTENNEGTHYTPMSLVDMILTETLTNSRLDSNATVLDCACGSGVFLVEAFKRMVQYKSRKDGIVPSKLPRDTLLKFLTQRITGIDVNPSAIQVAAFSLYLSYLDFREPHDIREHKQLPRLMNTAGDPTSGHTLYCYNAFMPTKAEALEYEALSGFTWNESILPVVNSKFDIVVGNPPWGAIKLGDSQLPFNWCKRFGFKVGDKELGQCFIWRAHKLLKPGGEIGLLVSTGVFFKHQQQSKEFRQQWLRKNSLRAVYSFAHVRQLFFRKQNDQSIAPFAAVFYGPSTEENCIRNRFSYICAKQSAFIESLQAVILDRTDIKRVDQGEMLRNEWLWKTYMWGNAKDVELIGELKSCYSPLYKWVSDYGMGYSVGGPPRTKTTDELGVDMELELDDFKKNLPINQLIKPIVKREIGRVRNVEAYHGPRLLVKRGISGSGIQARLAYEPFAFRNWLFAFRLDSISEGDRDALLGIVLSSLAKYYHFLTCSTWGFWHYEIHEEEHLNLPVSLPADSLAKDKLINLVHQIDVTLGVPSLFQSNRPDIKSAQKALDEAVYELYGLSEEQRGLIQDFCDMTLPFFNEGMKSNAVRPPTISFLKDYRDIFVYEWRERLRSRQKELECSIFAPKDGLLVGMAFDLVEVGKASKLEVNTEESEWRTWFTRLSKVLRQEWIAGVYIDRTIKALTDSSIVIVKRAERRFWSKSQAYVDSSEMLTEVFKTEWSSLE